MSTLPLSITNVPEQLQVCKVDDLKPHPGLLRLGLLTAVHKVSALADRGELAFADPLTVTHEDFILDGYARWTLAKTRGRREVRCLVRQLSEQEALIELLRAQHRSTHLNDFNRILLALELEEHFRAVARRNQQAGGRDKLVSDLTEAQRVDVRAEIARVAGVSTGNVNHARFLLEAAAPEVLAALKDDKIRIGRARDWLRHSTTCGRKELRDFRITRALRAKSRALLIARSASQCPIFSGPASAITRLSFETSLYSVQRRSNAG